jgi:hypothetical protein
VTKSPHEIAAVLKLSEDGLNISEISRITGVSRPAIRAWIGGQVPSRDHGASCPVCARCSELLPSREYAYLFGQYLGDGMLTLCPRGVWKLRIFTASAYPGIIDECAKAMAAVRPANRVGFVRPRDVAMVVLNSYSKHWKCLFPQAGPGLKHKRNLILEPWQGTVIMDFPGQFLRGLIHSDGCRVTNKVNSYQYPRYFFSNRSMDIQLLFGIACDLLEIEWRNNSRFSISIAKRDSVARMDEFVGPKL